MTNNTIKNKIREVLNECGAPEVIVSKIRGIEQTEENISINQVYVSMGMCTGTEFEAITEMRQRIENKYNINIVNMTIDL